MIEEKDTGKVQINYYLILFFLSLGIIAATYYFLQDYPKILFPAGIISGIIAAFLALSARIFRAKKLIKNEELLFLNKISDPLFPELNALMQEHIKAVENTQTTIEKLSDENDIMVDRYEVLTENLAAAIVIRDQHGKIAYCSPYTEVLTGYKLEEIYAETKSDFLLNIVHPEHHDEYLKALRISSCGEAFQFRYRFYHKSGIEMWAETRTVPIMDEQGEVTSCLSITFDVTSLIRRQQQIEEKNRDLEDFSYMISHDLKAPIFTIKGMIQILQEDLKITPESPSFELIKHITSATDRLEELVQSVVDYSRIGTGASSEEGIDMDKLLSDMQAEFKPQLDAASSTLTIKDKIPAVLGDRLKVYQIFSNLIGNAIKYRERSRASTIDISAEVTSPRYVQITVKDNGMGIPANRLQDIFRPFQRAHGRDIEGSGIGLACVKKLVNCLNGDVTVQSEVGVGSSFTVTLPLAAGTLNTTAIESDSIKSGEVKV